MKDPDDTMKMYNSLLKSIQEHTAPSPETERRLKEVEVTLSDISTQFQIFTSKVLDHFKQEEKEHGERDGKIDKILEQTTKHNGRMSKLELWKAQVDGGKIALKSVWGFAGIFVVASIFGLFQTYLAFQELPFTISQEVTKQLQHYQFELVE